MFVKALKRLLSWLEKTPPTAKTEPGIAPLKEDDEPVVHLYKPEERYIFRYYNGKEEVAADPLVLFKRYARVKDDLSHCVDGAYKGWKPSKGDDSLDLHTKAVAMMREIMELPPFENGTGLTDAEVPDCFSAMVKYCDHVKKNSSFWPTLPKDLSSYTRLFSGGSPPTPNTSESGETETSPSTEPPTPLNTESASPLAS